MSSSLPVIVVTGISGNLGQRLLAHLPDFSVCGVDRIAPPPQVVQTDLKRFVPLDLSHEASTRALTQLLKQLRPVAVVHLAFVLDPVRNGVLDVNQMWRINVAGTARVMEAVSEANRDGAGIATFLYPSSVAAYGPSLPGAVKEDYPLGAHTLPYAVHKREADQVVQARAESLGDCTTFILRPHIFTGASVDNYMVGAFRGTPNGKGAYAARMRANAERLPCVLPAGKQYLDNRIQFVHVDDMARLIGYLLRRVRMPEPRVNIFNVASRGEAISFAQCIQIAQARLLRTPNRWIMRLLLGAAWRFKISAIPPEALPYMIGEYIMDTTKLRDYLGASYTHVLRHTVESAYADSFAALPMAEAATATQQPAL